MLNLGKRRGAKGPFAFFLQRIQRRPFRRVKTTGQQTASILSPPKPDPTTSACHELIGLSLVPDLGAALGQARINAARPIQTEKLNPLLIELEQKQRRPVDSRRAPPRRSDSTRKDLFPLRRLRPQFERRGGATESKNRVIPKRWDVALRAGALGPRVSGQCPFMGYVAALTRSETREAWCRRPGEELEEMTRP